MYNCILTQVGNLIKTSEITSSSYYLLHANLMRMLKLKSLNTLVCHKVKCIFESATNKIVIVRLMVTVNFHPK